MAIKKRDRRFLRIVQRRVARVAVGASTVRGQGARGVVGEARHFLIELNLRPFGTTDRRRFGQLLDQATARLMRRLPAPAASWGLARKVVNIFLRDCLYTGYLMRAYHLAAAEPFMEIALDSITAKEIRSRDPRLPGFPRVKHLKPDQSARYQAAAEAIGRRAGLARVHLDGAWWADRE